MRSKNILYTILSILVLTFINLLVIPAIFWLTYGNNLSDEQSIPLLGKIMLFVEIVGVILICLFFIIKSKKSKNTI